MVLAAVTSALDTSACALAGSPAITAGTRAAALPATASSTFSLRRVHPAAPQRVGRVGEAEVREVLPGRVAQAVDDAPDPRDDAAVGLVPPAQQFAGVPDAAVVDLHGLRGTGERPRSTVLCHVPDSRWRGAAGGDDARAWDSCDGAVTRTPPGPVLRPCSLVLPTRGGAAR